jgi:hypothetical protein
VEGKTYTLQRFPFAASETDRVSKIYRAKGADINFEGIKQIHVGR